MMYLLTSDMKMKNKKGFTLLELLLVISIMILLMGMVGVSVGAAIERARISRARAESAELIRAWKQYYKTYGQWPDSFPANVNGRPFNKEMDGPAMAILLAQDPNDNPQNIKFIDLASAPNGFEDPWGNLYMIYFTAMNTDDVEVFETSVSLPANKRYIYEN
ncbi:hypothetical protein BVX97_00150 [bacterium E08(2017)]|nr:hypothetical protein BVX97_00150 [bacterium E08(2017)]